MQELSALVVEDEGPTRRKLLQLLKEYPGKIKVIAEASNGIDGVEAARKFRPDVIFLDIQMPGMDGFEVLRNLDYIPHVVFTTAYQEFAIRAFEENAADYLLKPIEAERLKKCVNRLQKTSGRISIEDIESTIRKIQSGKYAEIISVKSGDRVIPIRFSGIFYFKAEDKLVRIFSSKGSNFLIDNTLNTLEQTLPEYFLRIHRSLIVNTSHIMELKKYFNSRYLIYINDEIQTVLTSGKSYYLGIKKFFQL